MSHRAKLRRANLTRHALGGSDEATRVHHIYWRRGGLASCRARATDASISGRGLACKAMRMSTPFETSYVKNCAREATSRDKTWSLKSDPRMKSSISFLNSRQSWLISRSM
jgi:hypothetical protein